MAASTVTAGASFSRDSRGWEEDPPPISDPMEAEVEEEMQSHQPWLWSQSHWYITKWVMWQCRMDSGSSCDRRLVAKETCRGQEARWFVMRREGRLHPWKSHQLPKATHTPQSSTLPSVSPADPKEVGSKFPTASQPLWRDRCTGDKACQ